MKWSLLLISIIFITSCSNSERYERLNISATTWIGYAPLLYAKEKQWLDEYNITLTQVTSLAENMYMFEAQQSDAYVGTQYEYTVLSDRNIELYPIVLFDQSNGGDIILSNMPLQALGKQKHIDAYLELDSINSTLLNDFLSNYEISSEIKYHNKDQAEISTLKEENMPGPTIIVTYDPYQYKLQDNGFQEIASTKNGSNLLVIDALFTTPKKLIEHRTQFQAIKLMVDQALLDLNKDPKTFFNVIKHYMEGESYEDFQNSLTKIKWVNRPTKGLLEKIEASGLPLKNLL